MKTILPEIEALKTEHLEKLADHTRKLYREPDLRHLFLELTLRCNEHCFHCGSSCGDVPSPELSKEQYHRLLCEVKKDFDIRRIQLCITGGEPLLRRDFYEIMNDARELGFSWGMTSNALLIDREAAKKLKAAGMGTISVSIDGLPVTHDRLRGLKGAYEGAMRGIENLLLEGGFESIQVTSVFNHQNLSELDALFEIMNSLDIDSWRVINLEPIGRALSRPELMLTPDDYRRLFDFIADKRAQGYPVEYGCSHFLGLPYEVEVRDWYWLCNAGIHTASIMTNGDIAACLDIERRPELIQGNILKDRFSEVWKNGFQIFRKDLSDDAEMCRDCRHSKFCRGDAHHSYDYDHHRPMVCLKDVLF